MPFQRPTLSNLRSQVKADISSLISGADGLLRFGNLPVLGDAQAGLASLHYGYLDWISKQAVPFTATDEFLEGWAALKGITREAATSASGTVTFNGTNGTVLPSGSLVVRSDQVSFLTTANGTVSSGIVTVAATAQSPGAIANTTMGTVMMLGTAISGIQSNGTAATAFTGGADIETDNSLRSRMLEAYQNPPQGGAVDDYEEWALAVNGVTRVWILKNGQGAGTVVVYFMMDVTESAHNGYPQGANGVAASETRDTPATGDQLAVANYIYNLQPVTALVYAVAPTATPQNFTIKGLTPSGTTNQNAVAAAISDLFFREGKANGGTIALEDVNVAIAAVPGITDFIITSPTSDIVTTSGQLPSLGTITWT
jgi:uncharacterized phage protein gp47/JayE